VEGTYTLNISSQHKDKYKIVAVCDPMEDRRERAVKEYGCDAYADYKELIRSKRKDIDLVVNALPSHLLVPVTRDFLRALMFCVISRWQER